MKTSFELNESGNIVIDGKEYQLVNANVLYNIISLQEVISDEDLDKSIEDLDSGDEYTIRKSIIQQFQMHFHYLL